MKKYLFKLVVLLCLPSFLAIAQTNNVMNASFREKLAHPPPVPYFNITGLCFGDTTHFINRTESSVLYTEWSVLNDKGDTLFKSQNKDVAYYFKKRGYYTICLLANNGHIASKVRTVKVDTITKADFAFRYCYDEFENLSACSNQFVWVLPDNSTSTANSPTYSFAKPGVYPVKLYAKNGSKTDTLFKLIRVAGDSMGIPNAAFTFKRVDTSTTFEFTAVDTLADIYSWYFGDNQGDDTTGYRIVHHINRNEYTPPVNLFVSNACGFSIDMLDPFTATGIPEKAKLEFLMELYPNPVENELSVVINNLLPDKPISLRIIESNGSILKETRLRSNDKTLNFKYNTTSFSKGLYMLQMEVDGHLLSKKFIVR